MIFKNEFNNEPSKYQQRQVYLIFFRKNTNPLFFGFVTGEMIKTIYYEN